MVQGHGKRAIFRSDQDRLFFLSLLAEIHSRFGIEIHAYALMGNHFHLVVRTPTACLSKAMQYLNGQYARRFNAIYRLVGAVFRGRFKSILVTTDAYLVELPRYVHNNPVKAGMVACAAEHQWSSHRAYMGLEAAPSFLYCEATLDYFGGDTAAFGRFVDAPDTPTARAVIELLPTGDQAELIESVSEHGRSPAGSDGVHNHPTPIRKDHRLGNVEAAVRSTYELDDRLPLRAVPGSSFTALAVVIAMARRLGITDLDYLANRYGFITKSAARSASRRIEARSATDPRIAKLLDQATLMSLSEAA